MIFPLVQDFADALAAMPREHPRYRILKLLDEAIRRDVHFIDRHPTTFFQCMWNTCWWYDGPEAAGRFGPSGSPRLPAPARTPASKISSLMEGRRMHKDQHTTAFLNPGNRALIVDLEPVDDNSLKFAPVSPCGQQLCRRFRWISGTTECDEIVVFHQFQGEW